ncbi:MAG: hypothetical protein ACX94D_07420 [Henriciella sp.]|mmetsp:Transcript_1543/g.2040  ORF Transcript_1543/g.2040 Transcript_1543/m.2040 type:complete len:85 (-) Transcript_1543:38-292(-)
MQSFLTILLAGITAFFAFAMMPEESDTNREYLAETEPPLIVAEASPTPVFVIETVEPLVLALDAPNSLDGFADFEFDSLGVEID